jgi:hypothetical protein
MATTGDFSLAIDTSGLILWERLTTNHIRVTLPPGRH